MQLSGRLVYSWRFCVHSTVYVRSCDPLTGWLFVRHLRVGNRCCSHIDCCCPGSSGTWSVAAASITLITITTLGTLSTQRTLSTLIPVISTLGNLSTLSTLTTRCSAYHLPLEKPALPCTWWPARVAPGCCRSVDGPAGIPAARLSQIS